MNVKTINVLLAPSGSGFQDQEIILEKAGLKKPILDTWWRWLPTGNLARPARSLKNL
jgi:hypothetical protein